MDLNYGVLGLVILLTVVSIFSCIYTLFKYRGHVVPWFITTLAVTDIVVWVLVIAFWLGYFGHETFGLAFPVINR